MKTDFIFRGYLFNEPMDVRWAAFCTDLGLTFDYDLGSRRLTVFSNYFHRGAFTLCFGEARPVEGFYGLKPMGAPHSCAYVVEIDKEGGESPAPLCDSQMASLPGYAQALIGAQSFDLIAHVDWS